MGNLIGRLFRFFLNRRSTPSENLIDVLREKYLVAILMIGLGIAPFLFVTEAYQFGFFSVVTFINIVWMGSFVLSLVLIRLNFPRIVPTALMITAVSLGVFVTAAGGLGIYDASFFWLTFLPLVSSLLVGKRFALITTFGTCSLIIFFFLIYSSSSSNGSGVVGTSPFLQLAYILSIIFFSGLFSYSFDHIINLTSQELLASKKQLLEEKQKLFQSQKLASLGEMAGGIAHEINNPLAILQGQIFLQKKKLRAHDDGASLELNGKMMASIDRVVKIINGLQKFSRDGSTDDREWLEPAQIVEDILTLFGEKIQQNSIATTLLLGEKRSLILAQKTSISQVLSNIVNNAIHALEAVAIKQMTIEILEKDASLILAVSNNGPQIPEELQGKVMNPFFTTKPVGKGTGLGLSISNSIMKQNEGELALTSSPEKTTFQMIFKNVRAQKNQAS